MMRLFLISALSILFLSGCASTSFVKKEIARLEQKIEKNRESLAMTDAILEEVQIDAHCALSLGDQALWKANKVSMNAFEVIKEKEILFAFDSFELNMTAKNLLDSLGASLSDDLSFTLTIEGHTDWIGSNVYNFDLGKRRVESVKRYLNERGIELYRMFSISFGESAFKMSNITKAGRAENRRVVLQIWTPI